MDLESEHTTTKGYEVWIYVLYGGFRSIELPNDFPHLLQNMAELAQGGFRVFAIDVLGQGSSWPLRRPTAEDNLYISIDMWLSEIKAFALEVMGLTEMSGGSSGAESAVGDSGSESGSRSSSGGSGEGMFVAGNSLGGLLAVQLAATEPNLVRGLVLLNATPFWSFRPPLQSPDQVRSPRKIVEDVTPSRKPGLWD